MMIEVLKSKIHCARVTEANLNYMGSITIDEDMLDAVQKYCTANHADPLSGETDPEQAKQLLADEDAKEAFEEELEEELEELVP